jgi:ribonuclease PH
MRHDKRQPDELRPLHFRRRYTRQAPGSVLVRMGRTTVLCTCSIDLSVPPFLVGSGKGWLTAEYSMLPGSTSPRKSRDRSGRVDGRSAINGAFVALVDALHSNKLLLGPVRSVVRGSVAAVSVGLLNDVELLDLDYREDKDAEVDLNLVMTGAGQYVEVQGTGEEATFSRSQLDRLLKLGKVGIDAITQQQRKALGANWPLD